MKEILEPVARTVGFMLKVLKNNIQIEEFNPEFQMIRHGNYFEFINSVKAEVPFSVVWNKGEITSGNNARENDIDFLGLYNSIPSLNEFHNKCFLKYGAIDDLDIPDEMYGLAALFELSVRMHANNHNLVEPKEKLVNIITSLANFKNLSTAEIDALHQARRFLNMIKHFDNQFQTWEEGILALKSGYAVLREHKLRIA
jgi:hypothetical protein